MSKRLYVASKDGDIRAYSFDTGSLVLEQTRQLSGGREISGAAGIVDSLNKYIWHSLSDAGPHFLARAEINEDGTVEDSEKLDSLQGSGETGFSSRADAERILSVGNHTAGNGSVRLIKASDGSTLDTFSPTADLDVRSCCYLSDTRAVIADASGNLVLLSVEGDSISEVSTLAIGGSSLGVAHKRISATRTWAVEGSDIRVYDFGGDTITEVDSVAQAESPSGAIAKLSSNRAFSRRAAANITGGAISLDSLHDIDNNPIFAGDDSGSWAASATPTVTPADEVKLWETTGDPASASDTINTGSRIRFLDFSNSLGPTTPEQIFNATYSDASAAPPKRTALVRPLDVQRSIDTDVSWLAGNPKEWTLDVIIPVGELQHYRPGNVFFVRADVPGLREGRKVLLKGFSAIDIRPTEPVTCVFTGPSETT